MDSTRTCLLELIERGAIRPGDVGRAVDVSGLRPSGRAWRDFLDQVLLWLGVLALAFSVLFFIAYNWTELGRFARFALVELALLSATAVYWKKDGSGLASQAALMAATLLLGVLLALYGQVYQTGADPWQLFFNWALLMLPWALIGRFAAIWLVWLGLLNLSVILYHTAFSLLGFLFASSILSMLWSLVLINTPALIIWQFASHRWSWLDRDWARRLVAVASGASITSLLLYTIISESAIFPWLVYPLWLVGFYWFYRRVHPDLFMLAGACLSGILLTVVFVAENMLSLGVADAGSFLLLAILILGLSAAAAAWLKRVQREIRP